MGFIFGWVADSNLSPVAANLQLCDLEITPARIAISIISLLIVALCLLVLSLNSAARTALNTLTPEWLERVSQSQASTFRLLLAEPARLSNTVHTTNIICYVISPALAISAIHQYNIYDFTVTLMILVLVFVILFFTRTLPGRLALRHPERTALRFSRYLKTELAIVSPLTGFLTGLGEKMVKLDENRVAVADNPATPANYFRLNPNEVIADASLGLDEVNTFFHTRWTSKKVDTIEGFVYDKFGRTPRSGEELILDRHGSKRLSNAEIKPGDVTIVIMNIDGQRLRNLRLLRHAPGENAPPPLPPEDKTPPPVD